MNFLILFFLFLKNLLKMLVLVINIIKFLIMIKIFTWKIIFFYFSNQCYFLNDYLVLDFFSF